MTELADIFRRHGSEYFARYKNRLLPSHKRALQDIVQCRTESLGGHLFRCEQCEDLHYSYHSCKNRHCPKCMNDAAETWLSHGDSQGGRTKRPVVAGAILHGYIYTSRCLKAPGPQ